MRMKMWCLTIRIKKNDESNGKRLYKSLLEFLMQIRSQEPQYGLGLMVLASADALLSS